ncbi:MerR family transcriptional regulator [Dictyobacter sp. S3.2.2.5]|uniref:MerR family transcriptional regulator n=1 Tax=Dictyobacter halimunensis TaxID=3026934 RepID=A0ABQ6FM93_9CHLR|nr:MerR family transcriptional regulator [Dictyobacter sp. S3.2.2.5]
MMLKIGEFARLGQVSVATLRHYDSCGLLKPSMLDADTGYRYYTLEQLPRLNRILALKDLGFPLEQIACLLAGDLSLEQLRVLFERKQASVQQVIEAEQARLTRIAARIRQLEKEEIMPDYEVVIKYAEPLLVASARDRRLPGGHEKGRLYQVVIAYLDQQRASYLLPELVIWHSRHQQYDGEIFVDLEVAIPLRQPVVGNEQVKIQTLSGSLVASTIHKGNDLALGKAFITMHHWIEENGYRHIGPVRQRPLQHDPQMQPANFIVELQFPISRTNTITTEPPAAYKRII